MNLPSPIFTFPNPFSTGLLDLDSAFLIGTQDPTTGVGLYSINGPTTLGAGIIPTYALSSSDSGISSALIYNNPTILFLIDSTCVSGATINSSSTFTGITLASLGMPNSRTMGTWTLVDPGDPSYIGTPEKARSIAAQLVSAIKTR